MANYLEFPCVRRDPQTGRFRRETENVLLQDGTASGSFTENGDSQIWIFSNPELEGDADQVGEPNKFEGLVFRFIENGSDEVFCIPKGLELDFDNLTEIFGEKIMSNQRFISVSTQ